MTVATVTSKGQVTIPADIRESFGIAPGDQIVFYKSLDGDLRIHIRRPRPGAGMGMLSAKGRHVTIEEMDEAIAAAVVEKFERKVGIRPQEEDSE